MKIEKLSVITLIALGLAACSSNQPVPVVKGDKNVDYSQPKTIHISETNPYPTQATAAEYIKKPANATALCYNCIEPLKLRNKRIIGIWRNFSGISETEVLKTGALRCIAPLFYVEKSKNNELRKNG